MKQVNFRVNAPTEDHLIMYGFYNSSKLNILWSAKLTIFTEAKKATSQAAFFANNL
jgi:hypothetical protein